MKLNKDICEEHLNVLRVSNEQWFYDYHFSMEDYKRLVQSLEYFDGVRAQLADKITKEGLS